MLAVVEVNVLRFSVIFVSTSGFSWKTRSTLLVAAALSIDGEFACKPGFFGRETHN